MKIAQYLSGVNISAKKISGVLLWSDELGDLGIGAIWLLVISTVGSNGLSRQICNKILL